MMRGPRPRRTTISGRSVTGYEAETTGYCRPTEV